MRQFFRNIFKNYHAFKNQNKEVIMDIILTKDEVEIGIIHTNLQEEIIELEPRKLFYKQTIQFDNNEIIIGETDGLKLFFSNEHIKQRRIFYQGESFILSNREIIALFFYKFKRMIEHHWIIKEVNIELRNITIFSLIKRNKLNLN